MRCGAPLPAEEEAEEAEVTPVEEQEGTEEESSPEPVNAAEEEEK